MDAFDEPEHVIVRPENQLVLTEKELDEEVTKQLTANNPNAPANLARYDEKERAFKFEPTVDQLVVHYASDGFLLHDASDEAARQVALEELERKTMAEWVASIDPAAAKKAKGAEEGAEAGAEAAPGIPRVASIDLLRKMMMNHQPGMVAPVAPSPTMMHGMFPGATGMPNTGASD